MPNVLLQSLWIRFWSTMSAADCLTASAFNLLLNNLLSLFCCFFIFIENNVTVEHFLYFLFLPVASFAVLILHAMRYTLPYRCRPRRRRYRRQSRGLSLSIYFARKRVHHRRNLLYPNYHPRTDLNPYSLPFDRWKTHFYSSSSTSAFINSFDVLKHAQHFADPFIASLPKHYSPEASSTLRRRILFEASHLCSNLDNYGSFKPFCEPFVYTSSIPSELPIVIDTGASNSITPTLTDFTGPLQKPNISSLGSLTSVKTPVDGQGPISWHIEDSNGVRSKIDTTAYYVPSATIRLFSPQVYTTANKTASLHLDHTGLSLTLSNGVTVNFPIQHSNNLPFMLTSKAIADRQKSFKSQHLASSDSFQTITGFLFSSTHDCFRTSVVDYVTASTFLSPADDAIFKKSNWNLDSAQKELLRWHYKLGHINMFHVQSLLRKQPAVPSSTPTIVDIKERAIVPINNRSSHIQHPLCAACQLAKQKKRCPPTHTTGKHSESGGASDNIVRPGMRVSTDLYASTIRGRLPDTFGRESPDRQYSAGAIFVDQASKFVYVSHQVSTTASETVRSKHRFEAFAASFGVTVKSYLADNHPFDKSEWTTDCANQQQTCLFSGVGAHHQNPSERYQQTIFNMARTMMMHFAIHWPKAAETNLWPFAVDHAVYIWNHLPNMQSAIAPIDTFTELLHFGYRNLQRLHVFGCPVYVFDPKMQDGKKLPKWQRRSRRAVYLGTSQNHGSTVALVLNLETGKVSPQYHLIFDDDFSTIHSD